MKGVPQRKDFPCQRELRLTRMRRRPDLCAAPRVAARRVGTLAFSGACPRAWAPCLRLTSRLLVATNWTTTGHSSGKAKWRGTAYAPSFETLSASSSTGAHSPSTEKRCLTNYGGTQTEAASPRRRATRLNDHLGGYVGELDSPANDVMPCSRACAPASPLGHSPTTRPPRRHVGERGRLSAEPVRRHARGGRWLAALSSASDRVSGHGSPSVHLALHSPVGAEGLERRTSGYRNVRIPYGARLVRECPVWLPSATHESDDGVVDHVAQGGRHPLGMADGRSDLRGAASADLAQVWPPISEGLLLTSAEHRLSCEELEGVLTVDRRHEIGEHMMQGLRAREKP